MYNTLIPRGKRGGVILRGSCDYLPSFVSVLLSVVGESSLGLTFWNLGFGAIKFSI